MVNCSCAVGYLGPVPAVLLAQVQGNFLLAEQVIAEGTVLKLSFNLPLPPCLLGSGKRWLCFVFPLLESCSLVNIFCNVVLMVPSIYGK